MVLLPIARWLRSIPCFILSLGLTAALAGCGKGKGDLSGTVKHQNKLVQSGSVRVLGSDRIPRVTAIKEDGTYTITQIPVGNVQIAVNSPSPMGMKELPPNKFGKTNMPPDNPNWFAIPPKYAEFDTSGITFAIRKGDNSFIIELE